MSVKVKNISQAIDKIRGLETAEDLSNYGREFQMKLLNLLMKDRIFSFSILPIIKDEYITDIYLRKIFIVMKKYVEKYQSLPVLDNIKILLEDAGEKIGVYDKILKEVDKTSLEDRDFIMDNARKFCFSRFALNENEKIREALLSCDFEKAKSLSTEAFKFSGLNTTKTYNLKKDYEMVFKEEELHNPIQTPFKTFNDNMKGGPGAGNLVIMVAESNFGKSNALIAFSRHANFHGKNIVFFSFEIGGSDMLRRHIAGLNDIRQEDVKNNRNIIEMRLKDENLGEFVLIEERATNARIAVIKNHLEYLKSTGFFPDMICIDALNQLKLPLGMRVDNDNQKFEYLAEELRDLANEYELPVYTVMQTNRSGFNAEINDIQAIGKAIEPFQVADVLITFSQTRPMAAENKCYALLLKNRLGKKFICLECHYDPNKCIFGELSVVNDLLLLSNSQKEKINKSATNVVQKLRAGEFDKKKGEQ